MLLVPIVRASSRIDVDEGGHVDVVLVDVDIVLFLLLILSSEEMPEDEEQPLQQWCPKTGAIGSFVISQQTLQSKLVLAADDANLTWHHCRRRRCGVVVVARDPPLVLASDSSARRYCSPRGS